MTPKNNNQPKKRVPTLNALFDAYREALDKTDLRRTSIETFAAQNRAFLRWMDEHLPDAKVEHFTLEILEKHRVSLRHLRPSSEKGRMGAVKHFGDWLVAQLLLPENPARLVKCRRLDKPNQCVVTEAEVTLLLSGCDRIDKAKRPLYRALVYVLATTGLRHAELLDMKTGDFDLTTARLIVPDGKGGKRRVVYLADETMLYLREWLAVRDTMNCTHDWLWAYGKSLRIDYGTVNDILNSVKLVSGLGAHTNIKPHGLRHAYATRLLSQGVDLKTIQHLLGHAFLTTTDMYLHASDDRLQNVRNLATVRSVPDPAQAPGYAVTPHTQPTKFLPPDEKTKRPYLFGTSVPAAKKKVTKNFRTASQAKTPVRR